jgi:hypothetical protein
VTDKRLVLFATTHDCSLCHRGHAWYRIGSIDWLLPCFTTMDSVRLSRSLVGTQYLPRQTLRPSSIVLLELAQVVRNAIAGNTGGLFDYFAWRTLTG